MACGLSCSLGGRRVGAKAGPARKQVRSVRRIARGGLLVQRPASPGDSDVGVKMAPHAPAPEVRAIASAVAAAYSAPALRSVAGVVESR
jgi:hypothetical protein